MIRHTVLFKLKSNVPRQELDRIFTDIFHLTTELPGVISMTGGTCFFHDQNSESTFTHGFSIDFNDQAARNSFLTDSVSQLVKNNIINISAGGSKGVIGFDFGEWN